MLVAGGIAIGVNGTAGVAQWFGVYLAGNGELPTATVLITYATRWCSAHCGFRSPAH